MNHMHRVIALAALLLSGPFAQAQDAAYRSEIEDWRQERLSALRAPDGYLNLAGLFWLDAGSYTFGAAPDNDLVFPRALASRIGRLDVDESVVTMHVADGQDVWMEGGRVTEVAFETSDGQTSSPAGMGSLFWYLIDREGRIGLRLHDLESPALDALPPIPYFGIDRRYRVNGRLKPYPQPRVVSVGTVIDGLPYRPESPGIVEFELGGERYVLEAYSVGDQLFFVFGDQTNGRETYGAGRFLYSDKPGPDGLTVLDFNKAYNPPCAFNDFSTCPVASPRNRLATRITAGEQYVDALYVGSLTQQD